MRLSRPTAQQPVGFVPYHGLALARAGLQTRPGQGGDAAPMRADELLLLEGLEDEVERIAI